MIFEAEFASGLLPVVKREIERVINPHGRVLQSHRDDALQFTYEGRIEDILALRTVIAVYVVVQFDIPRPKALLGHEHFHRLSDCIKQFLDLSAYQSLYLSAAGSDSSVMTRIKDELAQHLNLFIGESEGDLLLRMRRTPKTAHGWDVLVRLTPRPLATRDWRVCNYEGALNASIASAMIDLSYPTPDDHFLNIGCGSGTILIERLLSGDSAYAVGVDIDSTVLACARQNMATGQLETRDITQTDAIQMPFASSTFDKLIADLPFGHLVGSHDENEWLYPAILNEAGRVARQSARFVVITHEINLIEQVIAQSAYWQLCETPINVTQSGLHPRIYVLERL